MDAPKKVRLGTTANNVEQIAKNLKTFFQMSQSSGFKHAWSNNNVEREQLIFLRQP